MADEKSGVKLIPVELQTSSVIWRIVGGIAVVVIGSLVGLCIIIFGLFSNAMDWEGYHKSEFPLVIVIGGIVILGVLIYGFSIIISAIRRRKRKRIS